MKNRKRYLNYKARQKKIEQCGFWYSNECPSCGEKLFHYDRFDAACCIACDVWTDEACDDPHCPYCADRPRIPSLALFMEENKNREKKDWLRRNYQHKNNGMLHHVRKRKLYTMEKEQ